MKRSPVTFAQLRRLLLDNGFLESRTEASSWRFQHPASGAIFLFRPYALDEKVSMPDLASTRTHLEWRGLLPGTTFDDALTKTPA
jgi:hypothetical protein